MTDLLVIAREMQSPWYADHMFYGEHAHSYTWSSPLQFSRAEVERVAGRAAALQDLLGMPLLHENAFYYAPFPGADISEAEFMAEVSTRAGTMRRSISTAFFPLRLSVVSMDLSFRSPGGTRRWT